MLYVPWYLPGDPAGVYWAMRNSRMSCSGVDFLLQGSSFCSGEEVTELTGGFAWFAM